MSKSHKAKGHLKKKKAPRTGKPVMIQLTDPAEVESIYEADATEGRRVFPKPRTNPHD